MQLDAWFKTTLGQEKGLSRWYIPKWESPFKLSSQTTSEGRRVLKEREREQEKLTMPRNRWRILHIRFKKRWSREHLNFIFTSILLKAQLKCHQGILSTRCREFKPHLNEAKGLGAATSSSLMPSIHKEVQIHRLGRDSGSPQKTALPCRCQWDPPRLAKGEVCTSHRGR